MFLAALLLLSAPPAQATNCGSALTKPIEINFMCVHGEVMSLWARDKFEKLLKDRGVQGIRVTNQGAAPAKGEDEELSETEAVKKLWGKHYVVPMTKLAIETYRKVASELSTREGREGLARKLAAEGNTALAHSLLTDPIAPPILIEAESLGLPAGAPGSDVYHEKLLERVLRGSGVYTL
jgi:hypothetical protein